MIVRKNNLPQVANQFECIIAWMNEEPLDTNGSYILQHTTRQVRAFVSELNYRIDVNTLHREKADTLDLNEIGRVKVTTTQPLLYDPYQINRMTGSFILIDAYSNTTVAAGMIRRRRRDLDESSRNSRSAKSSNVVWEDPGHPTDARERNGHKGAMLWFTGLSGSGKSTVARLLERRLFTLNIQTRFGRRQCAPRAQRRPRLLAGGPPGEHPACRRGRQAAFDHGNLVVCTFISPYQADWDFARRSSPEGASSKSMSNATSKSANVAIPRDSTPRR